jgi:plasmid segregation protein ParM
MANFICRAVDVGYWNLKFTLDENGTCRLFPSIAVRSPLERKPTSMLPERHTSIVWVEGEPFEVGPDTNLFSEVPILHADYSETPEYRALLYGALDAMQLTRIDLLVTGLPVHLHHSRGLRLKEQLIGTHTIRPGKTVEVADAAIVSQPLGGFVAHTDERGAWSSTQTRTTLLVDPGAFTFDWMLTRGLHEIPGKSGGIEWGVSEILKGVQQLMSRDFGELCWNLRRIDEGLRQGHLRIKGRQIDMAAYRAQVEPVATHAVRLMRNHIGSEHEIDEIVLVGGGASLFLRSIHREFPDRPVHVVNDGVFANVRGFQSIGNTLKNRRAGSADRASAAPQMSPS